MVDQSKPLYRADAIPNNSIYAVYNQAYDTSSKSFEHLDNFLTADSRYRPKQILKDGKIGQLQLERLSSPFDDLVARQGDTSQLPQLYESTRL